MKPETTDIEVEVLEIDGIAPVIRGSGAEEPSPQTGEWQDWRRWPGQVRQLDSRWWPLWVLLGILAVGLVLTVGLVVGAILLVWRGCRKILRALFG